MAKSKNRSNHAAKVAQRNQAIAHAKQKRQKAIDAAIEQYRAKYEESRLAETKRLSESTSQSKMLVDATDGIIVEHE